MNKNRVQTTCLPQCKCGDGMIEAIGQRNIESRFLFQFTQTSLSELKHNLIDQPDILKRRLQNVDGEMPDNVQYAY